MDAITRERIAELHPVVGGRWAGVDAVMTAQGVPLRVVQGLRTWTQQAALWAKGRTAPGEPCRHNGVTVPVGSCSAHPLGLTVTKAKPGETWHNFGLVLDAVPDDPTLPGYQPDWTAADWEKHEGWKKLWLAAKQHGFAEGHEWRTFPDAPHFYPEELSPSPDDEVRYLFNEGGLQAVWEWFDKKVQ